VTVMCYALEVSVSGFYAWRKRKPSQRSREDAELAGKIKTAFQSNRCVYGSPRIHAELHAQGIHCARKRVAHLMQALELVAKRPRHRTVTTKSEEVLTREQQSLRTCFNRTFILISPTRNGQVIPPTSGHKKGGCILPLCLTCSHAW
jgi:hypothetical protein